MPCYSCGCRSVGQHLSARLDYGSLRRCLSSTTKVGTLFAIAFLSKRLHQESIEGMFRSLAATGLCGQTRLPRSLEERNCTKSPVRVDPKWFTT